MSVLVDRVKTTYQAFFTIELEHPLYETVYTGVGISSISTDLYPVPDKDTKNLFNGYPANFGISNGAMICYTRTNGDELFSPIESVTSIRFLLKAQSRFLDRTILNPTRTMQQVYYFTNKDRTGSGSDKYLTSAATGVSDTDLLPVATVKPSEPCFAVIDIHIDDTGNDYRLLDATGKLMHCNYKIRFQPSLS
ncbi:MAG: hypothetical protein H7Y31_06120 [Chitinophagaceae bacterium]|nr:hypothetical protein [Chitinophagaceae bacterium]